ncbi:pantoate--beta-alanine ligase [Rhizobiales bacterium]|uniref:pantoate--beta-alanine ligase n=1 Tax=Hongsoonwoonella zoysiae TaxID=2821844 RepID=UPI00155FD2B2|nr:pantoate--beta-alanine ligase [Hongsoonwoonella zoysiae]NRG19191.1 pantoate--beta-alanine ligase [Hongsoonwoonella zoysiae]
MTAPEIHRTIDELRAALRPARQVGDRIAMVPTMGALHEGHLSLVERARVEADRVVVSIFVNPTQFAPHEDFDAYPRDEDKDLKLLGAFDVEAAFIPSVREMYPQGFATGVTVGGPSEGLESAFRPHFFDGVALVVTKLLLAAMPDVAIFGEKDYQQLCVVRRMARDLNIPTEIIGAPTVREPDGLAMSSRNVYLSPEERRTAASLPEILREAVERIVGGEDTHDVLPISRQRLEARGFKVDYLELRDGDTLGPVTDDTRSRRILVAAWLGKTRLIDNMAV